MSDNVSDNRVAGEVKKSATLLNKTIEDAVKRGLEVSLDVDDRGTMERPLQPVVSVRIKRSI